MAEGTAIEWADHTFNPWIGCTKVGPGCDHCYAEDLAHRWDMAEWGPGKERKRTAKSSWLKPPRWNRRAEAFFAEHGRRQRVFCASLADVFDKEAPAGVVAELFDMIEATPNLDWLLLTKRIGRVSRVLNDLDRAMPANVWLGITVVNQEEANRDIPKLLAEPAAKRFLSMEPLLGPVDLTRLPIAFGADPDAIWLNALNGYYYDELGERGNLQERTIDWVLVGGESGPASRPMHPEWARSLRDQCIEEGTAFLFKQWGEWLPRSQVAGTKMRVSAFSSGSTMELEDESFLRAGKKWSGRALDRVTYNGAPT